MRDVRVGVLLGEEPGQIAGSVVSSSSHLLHVNGEVIYVDPLKLLIQAEFSVICFFNSCSPATVV
jgi:hypothetical protein